MKNRKKAKILYVAADVLTVSRFVFAAGLVFLAYTGGSPMYALAMFVAAELTDAIDGWCARTARTDCRMSRNRDEDDRFWKILDQVADIVVGLALLVYVYVMISSKVVVIGLAVAIPFAVIVQAIRNRNLRKNFGLYDSMDVLDSGVNSLVIVRRWFYLLAMAALIALLVWNEPSWSVMVKTIITLIGALCGIVLVALKSDRLKLDKPETRIIYTKWLLRQRKKRQRAQERDAKKKSGRY